MKAVQQSDVLWMLALLLACLTVVCETSALAAPGITLLGGEHHISGSVIGTPSKDYSDLSTYDGSGGLPALHDSAQVDFGPDEFAQAESWVSVFSLRVETDARNRSAEAYADATWLFQPKWSTLKLCFNCFVYGDDPTFAELVDQTTGTSLYLWDDLYGPPEYVSDGVTIPFAVDPSHIYSLEASLYTSSRSDGNFHSAMNAVVVPVPSALLLGVFGAALVGRWRRR